MNEIAQALNKEIDLQRALQTTLALVAGLLGLRTGWIWLLSEDESSAYLAAAQNLPPGLARDPRRMTGTCYCLDTYRAGDLDGAANVNIITCSRLNNLVDGADGLRYHASIPLYAQERKLGVLNVASADWRALSPEDLRLLYTVGDLASIAIQRARLFEKSAQLGAVEERNRLAREIHDTLAQGLAAIVLQLEAADALLEGKTSESRAREAVLQALGLARANMEEARRSVHDLRSAPLEGRTLGQALAKLAEESSRRAGIGVVLETAGGDRPLPLRVEAAIYRCAQELLANSLRHGEARGVTMELAVEAEQVRLTVADDGQGFDPRRLPKGRYGLLGLQERARLLGGQVKVKSSPGAGTQVSVVVPLRSS